MFVQSFNGDSVHWQRRWVVVTYYCRTFSIAFFLQCTKRHEFAKEEGKRVLKRPYNKKKREQSIAEADVETEQRYYGLAGKDKEKVVSSDGGGAEKSASQSEDEDDGAIVTKRRRRRPPIGTLPAFIPL